MQLTESPKSTPLPQLRSSCKLTQKILSEPCPEFEQMQRILGMRETKQANALEVSNYVESAKQKRNSAHLEYYADNSLANFKKLVTANAEYDRVKSAFDYSLASFSGAMSEWEKGDDVRIATLEALRVIQKRLANKISQLNDEERKRMEEAGLDAALGEHPAISGLRQHLSAVAGAIIRLQDGGTFNWNEYTQLFQA